MPTLLIAIFLVVQIAVPTAALGLPRPARFSWQMYAGVRTTSEFVAVQGDGSEREIDPSDYLGNPRLDIDLADVLPGFVCETEPTVVFIRAEDQLSDEVVEYPCAP
ncbi:MAG: hypothetical protein R3A46_13905 [Thermomicrobiales bacterium]